MTLAEMPVGLRRYVVAVILAGPLAAAAAAVAGADVGGMTPWIWFQALLLTALVAASNARTLQVTHRLGYDVSEVGHVAMILLFPAWLPGILVGAACGVHLLRRSAWGNADLFNASQTVLSVTVAAAALAAAEGRPELGPSLAGLPPVGAIGVAVVLLLAVNMALVAGAVAFQTGAGFWRLFRGHVASVAGAFTAMAALGVVAALLVRQYPLALVPLVLPAAMAQYGLRREVQLLEDTREAMARLVDVVELRDPYTAGHSQRVAATARELAVRLGLTGEEADLVETAGQVHDLGKVAMDADLFSKQGPLTDAEWGRVREHPVHGAAIVERFAAYRGCAPLVRHHHERWDGGGYPAGLAGEAIPLGARILAVADAWDAMTTARAYRPAMGADKVLAILEDGAGVQWDPRVVGAFVAWRREAAAVADPALAARPLPA